MSEPENFLARWSRRKQAADASDSAARDETLRETDGTVRAPQSHLDDANKSPADATVPRVGVPDPAGTREASFDLRSLPPIETITAETDIRGFLAPGVPVDLARAALRRAWGTDPKIRDFVGLADYAWDYHAPGSMPGFGPLEMTDELRQAVARILGPPDRGKAHARDDAAPAEPGPYKNTNGFNASEAAARLPQQVSARSDGDSAGTGIPEDRTCGELTPRDRESPATQHGSRQSESFGSTARRNHGGALPR